MEHFSLDGYSFYHPEKNKGSILREKRLVLGLTQQQVADLAKISYCQYQRFESGERNIMTASFQIACRVIKALNMDINKFYNGDYHIGEPLKQTKDGIVYKSTSRPFDKEVE